MQNAEGSTNVNCLIFKTQQTDLKSVDASLTVWFQHYYPFAELKTTFGKKILARLCSHLRAGHTPRGWDRAVGAWPSRPAPRDAPPCRARACAVRTDRSRAPGWEVRGSREAAFGAPGPDPQGGLGARGRGAPREAGFLSYLPASWGRLSAPTSGGFVFRSTHRSGCGEAAGGTSVTASRGRGWKSARRLRCP